MANYSSLAEKFRHADMFRTCEQCGCCSSACPITGREGFNVRRILRHIELGLAREVAQTPHPWLCTTCGRCETVCPNGIAILDLIRPLRAMSRREDVPEGPAPCVRACPGGIDIPGYLRLIGQGEASRALRLILESVPFPGILGRVCTRPCEQQCKRGEVNEPIAICALKRYAADRAVDDNHGDLTAGPDTGKKVAVIGSGPAGLTAAFYLRKRGHHVTVFEKNHKAGGMMRYGIPAYRLPESVLEKEIGMILGLGVDLKTDKQLGRDFDLNQLTREGFHAIFLALGLQDSRRVEIEGVKLEGVFWGVQFLTAVAKRKAVRLKPRVVVVGGGNVAVDVALTALRVGAEKVTLACLEKLEEMPASPWEIKMAIEEGVDLRPSWGPNRILGKNGRVSGVEMVHCTSVFDDAGAFCPAFDDTRESIEADQVILAIGQTADLACLEEETDCRIQDCLIRVDEKSQQTDRPGVFAGGDVTGGPGSIIEAVAAGKKAASAIDRLLDGDGIIGGTTSETTTAECYEGKREKGFADLPRVALPSLPLSERRKSFVEVDLCLTDEVAVKEAGRCLQCDLELKMANRMRQQDPSCLEAREEKNGSND